MKSIKFYKFLLLFFILTGLTFISCNYIHDNDNDEFQKDTTKGELKTDIKVIKLNNAKFVDVEILMAAGKLKITDGADNLLEAGFIYNREDLKARIKYNVLDEKGTLKIIQPSTDNEYKIKSYKNIWDLRFNNNVPMNMLIKFGAGDADINVNELLIKNLDLKLGAGKANINLKNSKILKKVDIEMGVGDLTLDLTGDWEHNLNVDIEGGIGKLTILLPEKVGVKAEIEKGLTDINARKFIKDGSLYYNKSYNENKPFIEVKINTGIGQVNLETR